MAYQPAIAERVFGMKYRLQRSRFQFCHAQVRDLPANRCGVERKGTHGWLGGEAGHASPFLLRERACKDVFQRVKSALEDPVADKIDEFLFLVWWTGKFRGPLDVRAIAVCNRGQS